MSNRQPLLRIGVFFCVALFALGLIRLFWLRFETGDLYPPYSSLRSDPLGIQALYEGIDHLEGQTVSRNYRPLDHVSPAPGTTFVVCGLTRIPSVTEAPWKTILGKVTDGGGRMVLSLASTSPVRNEEDEEKEAGGDTGEEKAPPEEAAPESPALEVTLRSRSLDDIQGDEAMRQDVLESELLPAALVFRSPLFFEPTGPGWETVFSLEDEAVVIRRTWGAGEVVLVADSYIFSNEALRNHRFPGFLTWIVGDGPVVFDEYHHGLSRQPGISALMRKYRLQGVVLSLAVLVALLIWQRAVAFAPRPANPEEGGESQPQTDAADGWVGLMRRHIAPGNLLAVCHKAWETSTAADRFSREQARQVRDLINRQGEDPVSVYQSICELLKRGKTQ